VEAANEIINFFETEGSVANTTKVNTTKWTIRVDGVDDGEPVSTKVRMYNDGKVLAIEFRRRHGDSLRFGRLYRAAHRWLAARKFEVNGEDVADSDGSLPSDAGLWSAMDESSVYS
jgi:hypothetical protein